MNSNIGTPNLKYDHENLMTQFAEKRFIIDESVSINWFIRFFNLSDHFGKVVQSKQPKELEDLEEDHRIIRASGHLIPKNTSARIQEEFGR